MQKSKESGEQILLWLALGSWWGQKVTAVWIHVFQSNIRVPPAASGIPRITTAALADPALVTPTELWPLHDSVGPPSSVTSCILQLLFQPAARVTPSHCLSPWPAPAFHSRLPTAVTSSALFISRQTRFHFLAPGPYIPTILKVHISPDGASRLPHCLFCTLVFKVSLTFRQAKCFGARSQG